jgi:lipoprotein-anchoring transpeptidase ErfK/SrfK
MTSISRLSLSSLSQALACLVIPTALALTLVPAVAQSSNSSETTTQQKKQGASVEAATGNTKAQDAANAGAGDRKSTNSASAMDASAETSSKVGAGANDDAAADLGEVGDALRVQILLERAHFSPGVIDGLMGGNTRRALQAYQSAKGLPVTGEADGETLASLGGAEAAVLARHTLTADDVAGPFADTPEGPEAMSQVEALPFESVEEKVAERFHVTPGWLRKRNPDVELLAGSSIVVPKLDGATDLPKPARVVVDESDRSLLLEDEAGKVIAHFPVTTGSAQFPLPIGEWKVLGVATDPVWHFDPELIAGTDADAKKAEIPPGPNNPVGVVWIDLSKEHYGIHGTPEPAEIGKTASNGCIRMTNWSAMALAKVVGPGMQVTMRR